MANFEVLKPFRGIDEKKTFDEIGEIIEMTVTRAEKLEKNIEVESPGYGPVLKRLDESKKSTKSTDVDKTESVEK